jgi:hypothetical protein
MTDVSSAVHVHSTWSYDGHWKLARIAQTFGRLGYRVALMTEHDRGFSQERLDAYRLECAAASTDRCLLVPGIEYSDPENRVHTLTWGPVPFLGENRSTLDVLREVRGHGGLSVFAHPTRKHAVECFRPEWAPWLLGVEVFKRKSDGFDFSADGRRVHGQHPELMPFASIDFHSGKQHFPAAMRLDLDAAVSEQSVLAALAARRAQPRVLGLPAESWQRGPAPWLLRGAERARRSILGAVRGGRSAKT